MKHARNQFYVHILGSIFEIKGKGKIEMEYLQEVGFPRKKRI